MLLQLFRCFFKGRPSQRPAPCRSAIRKNIRNVKRPGTAGNARNGEGDSPDVAGESALSISSVKCLRRLIEFALLYSCTAAVTRGRNVSITRGCNILTRPIDDEIRGGAKLSRCNHLHMYTSARSITLYTRGRVDFTLRRECDQETS